MSKMGSDKYLNDYKSILDDDYITLSKCVHSIKEKYESECDFQEISNLNSKIIKIVDMIKDSDLFKLIQFNSLEQEIQQQNKEDTKDDRTMNLNKINEKSKKQGSRTLRPKKRK